MNILEETLGFVHIPSQRTGYIVDGPFHEFDKSGPKTEKGRWPITESWYECIWDDTGEKGDVCQSQFEWIPKHKRHITDGKRTCHCGPATIEGIVIHRGSEEQN